MAVRYPVTASHDSRSAVRGSSPSIAAMASSAVTLYPSILFEPRTARANVFRRSSPFHRRGVAKLYLSAFRVSSILPITSSSIWESLSAVKSIHKNSILLFAFSVIIIDFRQLVLYYHLNGGLEWMVQALPYLD